MCARGPCGSWRADAVSGTTPAATLDGMPSDDLAGLNPAQIEAVTAPPVPLLVVAGAGSGKTRVLTHRIANLVQEHGAPPSTILAITFTNKAASEMAERVNALLGRHATGMWVMTFHAACARILRADAARIGFRPSFSIYDAADQVRLVRSIIEDDLGRDAKRYPPRGVHARISMAKNQLVGPEQFIAENDGYFDTTAGEVYARYQARLLEAGAMDFDDLLVHTAHLLEQIPEARERWQHAFDHVLVDEYQDTNHAQYRLIRALADRHHSITVVGDSDQSIYSWRGADIRNILDFERDFPEARTIRLEQNYRSTQTILSAANAVIARNGGRREKRLWTDAGSGASIIGYVADDEHDEARFVSEEIDKLVDAHDVRPADVAVFYRTNAQSRVFEEVFIRTGQPYKVVGGVRFYERKEVRDALAYLRMLVNTADETLGKIEEIMLDVPSGRIAYAVMSSGGFLGLGEKLFAIPWGALTLDTNRECFVLDARAETFENAPGFDKDHWPTQAGDVQWHRDVHAHYGVQAGSALGSVVR